MPTPNIAGPMWQDVVILFEQGGVMMYPLLLCSLIALSLMFERAFVLRRRRLLPRADQAAAKAWLLGQGPAPQWDQEHLLGQVLQPLFPHLPLPIARLEERFADLGRQVKNRLQRGLALLDTIAGIAPLLGLLGTVLGMIQVFGQLSESGAAKMEALSSGISVALFTTVTGLCIGIPALVAANLYSRQVDNLILELEDQLNDLLDSCPQALIAP